MAFPSICGAGKAWSGVLPSPLRVTATFATAKVTRAVIDKFFGGSITGKQTPKNVYVTVQGVAFFDLIHGQTGVAPNGIELRALLSSCKS